MDYDGYGHNRTSDMYTIINTIVLQDDANQTKLGDVKRCCICKETWLF